MYTYYCKNMNCVGHLNGWERCLPMQHSISTAATVNLSAQHEAVAATANRVTDGFDAQNAGDTPGFRDVYWV